MEKKELEFYFKRALKNDAKFVAVVTEENNKKRELDILANYHDGHFSGKLDQYLNMFDEELQLKNYKEKKIINITFGNELEEIYSNLKWNEIVDKGEK